MKQIFKYSAPFVALALFALVSCSEDNETPAEVYNPVSLSAQHMVMAQTANDFSDSFFAAYNAAHADENYIISPLSLEYALAMCANGTDGEALTQLLDVMGFDKSQLGELNDFCRRLMTDMPKVSNRSRMSVFNNMWYNSAVVSDICPEFGNALKNYYDAGCNSSTADNVLNKVNGWIADKSAGRIRNCVDKIDPKYHSVIVNVLNFEGFWPDKLAVKKEKFNNADGSTVERDFIVADDNINTHRAEMGYMFDIAYSKGAYRLRIILPERDVALDDFIANLSEQYKNADHWEHISSEITFPKFKCSSKASLKDVLVEMGITEIFDDEKPNMSKISSVPAYLSDVLQAGTIEVDENGTVATVVTVGPPMASDPGPAYINDIVDRSFAFEIYESSTGTKLFQGRINNL